VTDCSSELICLSCHHSVRPFSVLKISHDLILSILQAVYSSRQCDFSVGLHLIYSPAALLGLATVKVKRVSLTSSDFIRLSNTLNGCRSINDSYNCPTPNDAVFGELGI